MYFPEKLEGYKPEVSNFIELGLEVRKMYMNLTYLLSAHISITIGVHFRVLRLSLDPALLSSCSSTLALSLELIQNFEILFYFKRSTY